MCELNHDECQNVQGENNKATFLRKAIQKGIESPKVENFNFDENLANLKAILKIAKPCSIAELKNNLNA